MIISSGDGIWVSSVLRYSSSRSSFLLCALLVDRGRLACSEIASGLDGRLGNRYLCGVRMVARCGSVSAKNQKHFEGMHRYQTGDCVQNFIPICLCVIVSIFAFPPWGQN